MNSVPAGSIIHITASRGPARASLIADFEKVNSCVLQGGSDTHSSVRRCDQERGGGVLRVSLLLSVKIGCFF